MRLIDAVLGPVGAEQDAAYRRAEKLLSDSLPPDDYAAYRAHGYVQVPSRSVPHRTYRIDGWRPVAVYEDGRFVGAICINSKEYLPGPDLLLARKLMIEGAEDEFLRTGNWLKPTWRPAGATPVLFLLLALTSPWVFYLQELGLAGLLAGLALLALPFAVLGWRRRRISPRA